jgi:two-component system response regulator YesN
VRKVLIADDEYLVRLGLRTMVDWSSHGFLIVGEAANGREAIDLFNQTDPDVLLTDIKMPLVDGLQLIETLKAKKPSLYVVILSNYGDFAYAQRAIKLGASEYILKSDMNQESILHTLNRVLHDMEAVGQTPHRDHEPALHEYLRQTLTLPRLSRPGSPPQNCLAPGRYAVVICRCDTSVLAAEAQPMFHRSSRTMLEELWPKAVISSAQSGDILSVMLVAPLESEEDFQNLRQHAMRAALNIRQYYDVEFQFGISLPGECGKLPELIQQAASAFED